MLRVVIDTLAVWGMRAAAVVLAPLLLFTARTWHGRAVGALFVALWTGFLTVVEFEIQSWFPPFAYVNGGWVPQPLPFGIPRGLLDALTIVALLLGFAAFLWCWVIAAFLLFSQPAFRSDTPGLRSAFLGPLFLHRLQMVLLSEPDWLWLGTLVATRLDLRITRDDRRLLRDAVRLHLDELRESNEHRTVPPALPLAIWGRVLNPDPGHLFVYRPDAEPGERLGLLVFLHGHGGNNLLLPHLLQPLADRCRCVLVCPSFGYGNWEHPRSAGCVERAVRYAMEHFAEIDPEKVWLAGLSQGGAGVGRAAVAMPDTFAGLVFISPTMEAGVLDNEALADQRVLIVHGDADRHVKLKTVEKGIEALSRCGADVTVHRDPTGTHFLLFARAEDVFGQIAEWMCG